MKDLLSASGPDSTLRKEFEELGGDLQPGRIITAFRDRYILRTASGDVNAEAAGNLFYADASGEGLPAVGDWAAATVYDDTAIIRKIFPRRSVLARKTAGRNYERQIIAANIDTAFIVQGLDRDFSLSRLERYITVVLDGGIAPAVILNKSDLAGPEISSDAVSRVKSRFPDYPLILTSVKVKTGLDNLKSHLRPGFTFCFLGSSGVGKSSLINALSESFSAETRALSESTGKGVHTTTRRELHVLNDGSILVDTPGMREIGIADAENGLDLTFTHISELAESCRFSDCSHTSEPGCAVRSAVESGELDRRQYENYLRLRRETEHYSRNVEQRRRKDRQTGKLYRQIMKEKKKQSGKHSNR